MAPVIEEIDDDDIDNKHFELGEFDEANPFSKHMPDESGVAKLKPSTQTSRQSSTPPPQRTAPQPQPSMPIPEIQGNMAQRPRFVGEREPPEFVKQWPVLYPVYFDKKRSVAAGRRVPFRDAVHNPLAVQIADACRSLGLDVALELTKRHPKDWANPGRVRVQIPSGRTKRELFKDISAYLRANPATDATARPQMYHQIAMFDSVHPLAVPRGMTMGSILPGVSPALSANKALEQMFKADGSDLSKMFGM